MTARPDRERTVVARLRALQYEVKAAAPREALKPVSRRSKHKVFRGLRCPEENLFGIFGVKAAA